MANDTHPLAYMEHDNYDESSVHMNPASSTRTRVATRRFL